MKKKVFTMFCAVLTLAVSMLLGAIFGSVAHLAKTPQAEEVGRTVVASLK
jgi:hypothetical protein